MGRGLGKWTALTLFCAQLAACALQPGRHDAAAQSAQAMGNSAQATSAAASPEGAAVAAELGYHGPVRRETKPLD